MDFSSAAGQFCDDLFRQIVTPDNQANNCVSPLSLLTILAIMMTGARNNSKNQLQKVHHLPNNVNGSDIDNYYHQLLNVYKNISNSNENDNNDESDFFANITAETFKTNKTLDLGIEISDTENETEAEKQKNMQLLVNSLVLASNDGINTLLPEFENTLKEKYNSEVRLVDFSTRGEQIKNQVNNWVNKNTNGLIPSIINQAPDSDSKLIVLNAVYFQAKWDEPFNYKEDRNFYVNGVNKKTKKFMAKKRNYLKYLEIPYSGSEVPWYTTDSIQLVSINYRERDRFSMVIIIPPRYSTINSFINEFSITNLIDKLYAQRYGTYINLFMPLFTIETKMDMKEYFSKMGANDIFNENADFSGIVEKGNIFVSQLKHATKIEVDTLGTKAAATTYVEWIQLSAHPPEPKDIVVDRPFIYVVLDKEINLPIFMGKVEDPSV